MNTKAKVSCFSIVDNSDMLNWAIKTFHCQSYPNKELIVGVTDINILDQSNFGDIIKMIYIDHSNDDISKLIHYSTGDFGCKWPANAWCHSNRIEIQLKIINEMHKEACMLSTILFFSRTDEMGYISFPDTYDGTLLFRIKAYFQYQSTAKTKKITFQEWLLQQNAVHGLIFPFLFISFLNNDRSVLIQRTHFLGLSKPLSKELSTELKNIIFNGLSEVDSLSANRILKSIDNFHWIKRFPPFPEIPESPLTPLEFNGL